MNIPFHEIGINSTHGNVVVDAMIVYMDAHPGESVSLQKVIEQTGFPGEEVRDVFFALLTLRYLRATFSPRHKNCNSAIGPEEKSVAEIHRKLEEGSYPEICARCHEDILDGDDLDIEIIFWKGRGDLNV